MDVLQITFALYVLAECSMVIDSIMYFVQCRNQKYMLDIFLSFTPNQYQGLPHKKFRTDTSKK